MRKSKRQKRAKVKRDARRLEAEGLRAKVLVSVILLYLRHKAFLNLAILLASEMVPRSNLRHEKIKVRIGARTHERHRFNY